MRRPASPSSNFRGSLNVLDGVLQAGQDPAVSKGQRRRLAEASYPSRFMRQSATRSRSYWQSFALLRCGSNKTHIVARRIACNEHEAQRIGSIFVNNFQGVNAVTQGFTHLPALFIADKTMDEDMLKGNFLHKFHAHGDHAGNPEENDVIARHQDARRIKLLQFVRLVRPAKGGKRP